MRRCVDADISILIRDFAAPRWSPVCLPTVAPICRRLSFLWLASTVYNSCSLLLLCCDGMQDKSSLMAALRPKKKSSVFGPDGLPLKR